MVNAVKGVLIECDIPMKQFIVSLNDELPNAQKFIIYDLDDTRLFIHPSAAEMVKKKIEEYTNAITYDKPM